MSAVVRQSVEWLLVAGAHEVLARPAWARLSDPKHAEKVAAAAGVVAYARAREERARCYGALTLGFVATPILWGKLFGVAAAEGRALR
ncbi:MAG TPA: hypothetical protein VE987_12980 [Polyangiaceae bacterium]|nr:hypothetical protein [Polyangiaceae bacterium]